jgi:hypothetical protein
MHVLSLHGYKTGWETKGLNHPTFKLNTVTVKCCSIQTLRWGTTLASAYATGLLSAEVW